jgi:hypothetical protein
LKAPQKSLYNDFVCLALNGLLHRTNAYTELAVESLVLSSGYLKSPILMYMIDITSTIRIYCPQPFIGGGILKKNHQLLDRAHKFLLEIPIKMEVDVMFMSPLFIKE